jgi:hypothetical protein
VEKRLALGPSGQIPQHPQTAAKPPLDLPPKIKRFDVDFARAADAWDEAMQYVKREFTAP